MDIDYLTKMFYLKKEESSIEVINKIRQLKDRVKD